MLQQGTAAQAVPAPVISVCPLGHAETVLNNGHIGMYLAILH